MNIHEYQGKALLKANGVPVLDGVHCTTVDQALAAYDSLGSKVVAVKSQIHAGGRGKGTLYRPETREHVMDGGVKIAFSKDEVQTYATNILGNLLVTIQTGDDGKVVNNLYVEAGCDIAHEYYLAILVDRENKAVLIMGVVLSTLLSELCWLWLSPSMARDPSDRVSVSLTNATPSDTWRWVAEDGSSRRNVAIDAVPV